MPARRGVLRAVAALAAVPLAGCPDGTPTEERPVDSPAETTRTETETRTDATATTDAPTETATDTPGTTTDGTETTTDGTPTPSPTAQVDCDALSYEARTVPAGRGTPATVTVSETFLEVTVTVDATDPPDLGGTIRTCAGPQAVQRDIEGGEQTLRFGPYERGCVEEWEFWLVGCREATPTGTATGTAGPTATGNGTDAPNGTTQGL